ncbi:MAG: two-component system, cell cycle response regulator [Campylobacterota bacterium]|nr:two-component system, cell cycle response regulator [Campylobacterota bacterium]
MRTETITSSFTKHYVIAISLLAFLSTIAFITLHIGLKESASSALIVNISGKQRMLSQRIASLSQQYYLITYGCEKFTSSSHDELESNLQTLINQMRFNNKALSTGYLNPTTQVELSGSIREIYFGRNDLEKRVNTYLQLSENLLHTKSKTQALEILPKLISLSNTLLPDLTSTVLQYQKESENNITIMHSIAFTALILILFTLLIESLFIFRPMANEIQNLFQEILSNQKNLEQQVESRTLTLEQANQKLAHLASHDPLTGLKNRLNLESDLETLLKHYYKNHVPYAVAMLDIDWFKAINDNYGHDVGDFVLCEIAKILIENIREEDNVYRAGGEEFVMLFNRITQEEAINRVDKIRLILQEHLFVFNVFAFRITISGGLYHPDIIQADNVQEILKLADIALYEAKHLGRNQIVTVQKNQK